MKQIKTTSRVHTHNAPIEKHNERDPEQTAKENAYSPHIDPEGEHEVWMDGSIRETYDDLFSDAIADYDARQTRDERKIGSVDNYMNKVLADTRGRVKSTIGKDGKHKPLPGEKKGKKLAYEMVVSAGSVERGYTDENGVWQDLDDIPPEVNKAAVRRYFDEWPQRNPNLRLSRVDWHADEYRERKTGVFWQPDDRLYGTGHAHGIFVPYATGYKQGMSVQTSLNKALAAMGYKDTGGKSSASGDKFSCAMDQWCRSEQRAFEGILQEELSAYYKTDVEVTYMHPYAGRRAAGMSTAEYKAVRAAREELTAVAEQQDAEMTWREDQVADRERSATDREQTLDLQAARLQKQAKQQEKTEASLGRRKRKLDKQHEEQKDTDREQAEREKQLQEREQRLKAQEGDFSRQRIKYARDVNDALDGLQTCSEAYQKASDDAGLIAYTKTIKFGDGTTVYDAYLHKQAQQAADLRRQEESARKRAAMLAERTDSTMDAIRHNAGYGNDWQYGD